MNKEVKKRYMKAMALLHTKMESTSGPDWKNNKKEVKTIEKASVKMAKNEIILEKIKKNPPKTFIGKFIYRKYIKAARIK